MADPSATAVIRPSQGAHLVLDASWLGGPSAMLIPRTRDGRVLFAVPWLGHVLLGTTDAPRTHAPDDPAVADEEIEFLLSTAAGYFDRPPRRADVRASFAGLRPLYSMSSGMATAGLSREHAVLQEHAGLLSVVGGKWTTYRRMAQDALHVAAAAGLVPAGISRTDSLELVQDEVLLRNAAAICDEDFDAYCRSHTLARNAEDILFRRSRQGLLGGGTKQESTRRD
jgi:glycerol-3-phosphate dehydrogenase